MLRTTSNNIINIIFELLEPIYISRDKYAVVLVILFSILKSRVIKVDTIIIGLELLRILADEFSKTFGRVLSSFKDCETALRTDNN